ncbi:hypothetical protein BH23ACT10_BH23ACT10_23590 [soil metagenome]
MIFVDTSAWYEATADEGPVADAIERLMNDNAADLATSVPVLTELWPLIASRRNATLATAACLDVSINAEVFTVDREDHDRALAIMRGWSDQAFSYADATSFALMARTRIDTVLSLDDHFRVYRHGRHRAQAFHVLP